MTTSSQFKEGKTMRVGVILFPGFQTLDLFGPLDVLNMLAIEKPMTLAVISETLDPVSTDAPLDTFPIPGVAEAPVSTNFKQFIVPTHTFSTAPPLDFLIVPGGVGTWSYRSTQAAVDFIKGVYPSLTYFMTICSGATLAARAGVLDSRRATITKATYKLLTPQFPTVNWVSHARWVVDGNVWTSSGIVSGLDTILAWVGDVYGKEVADKLALVMEFKRIEDSSFDEFAGLHGLV